MTAEPEGAAAGTRPVRRLLPVLENVGESTTACLLAMVQGNLLILSASHWAIASQTGIIAGVAASAALWASGARRRWVVAAVLGAVTAGVDFLVHPGMFGPTGAEALATGAMAALLSWAVGAGVARLRGAGILSGSAGSSTGGGPSRD